MVFFILFFTIPTPLLCVFVPSLGPWVDGIGLGPVLGCVVYHPRRFPIDHENASHPTQAQKDYEWTDVQEQENAGLFLLWLF